MVSGPKWNINLNVGGQDQTISQWHHGSAAFNKKLEGKSPDELRDMLKNPKLAPGERRDVLNKLMLDKANQLAEIVNDPNADPQIKEQAMKDLNAIMTVSTKIKDGKPVTEEDLDGLAKAIGMNPDDLNLSKDKSFWDKQK
jgi:hypothetical protein